jgi:hypothetical protein
MPGVIASLENNPETRASTEMFALPLLTPMRFATAGAGGKWRPCQEHTNHGLGCVAKKSHKISRVVIPVLELKSGLNGMFPDTFMGTVYQV